MLDGSWQLFIVDQNDQRRAHITYNLVDFGAYAVPLDDLSGLRISDRKPALFLIEETLIDQLEEISDEHMAYYPFIAFSDKPSARSIVNALDRGAIDYLDAPEDPVAVRHVITEAARRVAFQAKRSTARLKAAALLKRLTRREREVLNGMSEGLTSRIIGDDLGISYRTVEVHRANLMLKLGADSAIAAVRVYLEAQDYFTRTNTDTSSPATLDAGR